MELNNKILIASPEQDYELIDSGENVKLERFGSVVMARPDPQALWPTDTAGPEWNKAVARFSKDGSSEERGEWKFSTSVPEKWVIEYAGLKLQIKPTPFKHTGLFPEQIINWKWSENLIKERIASGAVDAPRPQVLNLFGYTGGASLIAARAGAEVTHVDASKAAITWANENAELSGLSDKPIRWMLDDAAEFVKREIRRGKKYDAIIMDPPAFGRGAKGELWKIEEAFLPFFKNCIELLSDNPLFVIVNGYSAGYSAIAYAQNLNPLVEKFGGEIEAGELTIQETGPHKRLLPCGIVARWKR